MVPGYTGWLVAGLDPTLRLRFTHTHYVYTFTLIYFGLPCTIVTVYGCYPLPVADLQPVVGYVARVPPHTFPFPVDLRLPHRWAVDYTTTLPHVADCCYIASAPERLRLRYSVVVVVRVPDFWRLLAVAVTPDLLAPG